MNGVTVTAWLKLRNKPDRRGVGSCALRIGSFISGTDDDRDLLDFRRERLFNQDSKQRFLVAVSVDKSLKRQRTLRPRSGTNDSFLD
jgi:hypothetical protein